MSHDPNRKAALAAISAAVTSYLGTYEQAPLPARTTAAVVSPMIAAGNFYSAHGRQQTMEMRRLLSLRLTRAGR